MSRALHLDDDALVEQIDRGADPGDGRAGTPSGADGHPLAASHPAVRGGASGACS